MKRTKQRQPSFIPLTIGFVTNRKKTALTPSESTVMIVAFAVTSPWPSKAEITPRPSTTKALEVKNPANMAVTESIKKLLDRKPTRHLAFERNKMVRSSRPPAKRLTKWREKVTVTILVNRVMAKAASITVIGVFALAKSSGRQSAPIAPALKTTNVKSRQATKSPPRNTPSTARFLETLLPPLVGRLEEITGRLGPGNAQRNMTSVKQ